MSEFIASEYQEKIFEFFSEGVGNAVINAKAGSGKTSTAVKALEYIPSNKRVLYVAFNRDIVSVLKQKIGDKPNIHVTTYHSLGLKIINECLGNGIQIDQYKYNSYLQHNISTLSNGEYDNLRKENKRDYLRNCLKLIDLSRVNCCQSIREIEKIIVKYGIITEANESTTVNNILKWGRGYTDCIDYTDMIWLPYELGLLTKQWRFDWVIIDEAQDSSPVQQELFKKCLAKGGRFCCIGDKDQTINAWCGGDDEAFAKFSKMPNVSFFDLPISYRCPKKVIELARTIVPDIQYADNAIEGEVNKDVSQYKAKSGDMVLCRNTAPLTKLYTFYLQRNIKSYIRGAEIGNGLNTLIDNTGQELLSLDFSDVGVVPVLYVQLFKLAKKIMTKNNLSSEMALETDEFLSQYDGVRVIEILSEGMTTAEELKKRINNIFIDERKGDGICLSTIHKAKGLESDNIFILCPSLMPSKHAKKPWEIEAEKNLEYVAYTRAKKTLNFISEKFFPPHLVYTADDDFASNLKEIHKKLDAIGIDETLEVKVQAKKPTTRNRRANTNNTQPKREAVTKKIGAKKFGKFL